MRYFVYRELSTNEEVDVEDADEYVMDRLGITVTPKGKHGEMTQEQLENIMETTNWFFSGNWVKEEKVED